MPIISPGFAHVAFPLRHNLLGRSAYVTWGVDYPAQTPDVTLTNNIGIDFSNAIRAQIDSEVTLGPATVTYGVDGSENLTIVGTTSEPGQNVGSANPPNVAVLALKNTARGGRRGRGRMFIPWCVSEAAVSEIGLITEATRVAIQAALNTWITNATNNNRPVVLLHSPGNSVPGPANLVTGITVSSLIGTQRRRLGR